MNAQQENSAGGAPSEVARMQPANPIYRGVGFLLLFLIIAAIVFVFLKTLVFDQPINDHALRQALVAASAGVTIICLIAWVLHLLQITELRPGWAKVLWTVLVSSTLGNSVLVYKQFATEKIDALRVVCVRPVSIDQSTGRFSDPVSVTNDEGHKRGGAFGFLLAVRNLQVDPNGDRSFNLRWEYDDDRTAVFGEGSYSGNAKKLAKDPAARKKIEAYKKAAPDCISGEEDEVQLLVRSNIQPTDPRNGSHQLNITVYDNVAKTFALATLATKLIE
jgi:hypothetical protein